MPPPSAGLRYPQSRRHDRSAHPHAPAGQGAHRNPRIEPHGSAPVLLRGHGAVVVGPSLHVVVGRAYYMTVNARTELQAIALGGGIGNVTFLAPEEAEKAAAQDGFERAWTLWKSKIEKQGK